LEIADRVPHLVRRNGIDQIADLPQQLSRFAGAELPRNDHSCMLASRVMPAPGEPEEVVSVVSQNRPATARGKGELLFVRKPDEADCEDIRSLDAPVPEQYGEAIGDVFVGIEGDEQPV